MGNNERTKEEKQMKEWQKIAESQHRVLIGVTVMLVIILILVILSMASITKTMKVKDQIIEGLENKIERGIKNERI